MLIVIAEVDVNDIVPLKFFWTKKPPASSAGLPFATVPFRVKTAVWPVTNGAIAGCKNEKLTLRDPATVLDPVAVE